MNRGILIALALLATPLAHGQEQATKGSSGAKAAPTQKQRAKKSPPPKDAAKTPDAGSSSAWGGTGSGETAKDLAAKRKSAAAKPKHAAERAAMLRLRATYRYAVESCDRQNRACDQALVDDAEHRFMDGCLECATREQCEGERDVIRGGNSKTPTSLCSE